MIFATRGKQHRKYQGLWLPRRQKHRYLRCFLLRKCQKCQKNPKTPPIWRFLGPTKMRKSDVSFTAFSACDSITGNGHMHVCHLPSSFPNYPQHSALLPGLDHTFSFSLLLWALSFPTLPNLCCQHKLLSLTATNAPNSKGIAGVPSSTINQPAVGIPPFWEAPDIGPNHLNPILISKHRRTRWPSPPALVKIGRPFHGNHHFLIGKSPVSGPWRAMFKYQRATMWSKQCHKPPIREWLMPPIKKGDDWGMVDDMVLTTFRQHNDQPRISGVHLQTHLGNDRWIIWWDYQLQSEPSSMGKYGTILCFNQ